VQAGRDVNAIAPAPRPPSKEDESA
jgi:hypothetical protein